MVTMGVPTVRMGPPPGPDAPLYPGVSAKQFDPASAMRVYGDLSMKEMSLRYTAQRLGTALQHDPNGHEDLAMGDMLPGYRSLDCTYKRLGYTISPVGIPSPPQLGRPQPPGPITKFDMQKPPLKGRSRILARSTSLPTAAQAIPGGGNAGASVPAGGRRRSGSNVSANAPPGRSRSSVSANAPAGRSSLSANAPLGRSSLGANAPLARSNVSASAPLAETEVGTNSTFWSLPPANLSQLSRAAPSSVVPGLPPLEPTLEAQLMALVKSQVEKPFALL